MGLKSLIIPSLIQNAELPDFGISYRLEMIPKDRQFYLPFVETYSGSLPQKHFNSVEHFFACLSEMLKKISMIYNAFKVENNNKLKVAHPLYLVYINKSNSTQHPIVTNCLAQYTEQCKGI